MSVTIASALTLPCGVTLKNRLAKGAMTEGLATANHQPNSRHYTLYERWAEGGAGLLLTGNVMVDRRYLERPGNVVIDGEQSEVQKAALNQLARVATGNNTHAWVQLSHAGRQTPKHVTKEPVGPSAVTVKLPGNQFCKPRALTSDEIEEVIQRFAHAAGVAKNAGFTGVQVHSAHGYLLSEFLNPRTNVRDDEWGGSLENRARLLLRTVAAVREVVGDAFPVSVKLNSSDFQQGGYTFEDCQKVVVWLQDVGIDLLEISGGSYEQPTMMGMEGLEPATEVAPKRASTIAREAYFLDYANAIANIVTTPLMVTGGFRSVKIMNDALKHGAANVIGIARPLCVTADLPQQLLDGHIDTAISWENSLRLGPGWLGPGSPINLIKTLNGFGNMAFFYHNLERLADGEETQTRLPLLPAFLRLQLAEMRKGKELNS